MNKNLLGRTLFLRDSFSQRVHNIVKKIPKGKVATYKQVAKAVENPKAARAVGMVLAKNPTPIFIPCHRVILSNSSLGGYIKGSKVKIKLLKSEGIKIKNGKIDLKKYGWAEF